MLKYFSVGDIIYGYCNGFFGRDDYETKVCVKVTPHYAVFEFMGVYQTGEATVLNFSNIEGRMTPEQVTKWKEPENEE